MANTIQIKSGNLAPRDGVLADAELGFDKTAETLYIGKNGQCIKIGQRVEDQTYVATDDGNGNIIIRPYDPNVDDFLHGGVMRGTLNMDGNKLTNLPNPVDNKDAVPFGFAKDKFALNGISISPDKEGMYGKWGYCWSGYGNTYNNFIGDNYYLGTDSEGNVWSGFQVNGAQKITWRRLSTIDCVVAEGESGGWHYRKWNNGIAECWLAKGYHFDRPEGMHGNFYSYLVEVPYPIQYIRTPNAIAQTDVDGFSQVIWHPNCDKVAVVRLHSFTKYGTSNGCTIYIHCIGYWK